MHNLPEPAAVTAMQGRVEQQLEELDLIRSASKKTDLEALAEAFKLSGEDALHRLVQAYISKHHDGNREGGND